MRQSTGKQFTIIVAKSAGTERSRKRPGKGRSLMENELNQEQVDALLEWAGKLYESGYFAGKASRDADIADLKSRLRAYEETSKCGHMKNFQHMSNPDAFNRIADNYIELMNPNCTACVREKVIERTAYDRGLGDAADAARYIQAANEAALRELCYRLAPCEFPMTPHDTSESCVTMVDIQDVCKSLIPQPSALDMLLAEARLEEAERWYESWDGEDIHGRGKRLAELRSAVKGESNA